MCGICGFVRPSRSLGAEEESIAGRMNKKLWHRGPDAQDTLLLEEIAFGFSRLSIIGLENGMQPIWNEDRSVLVVCNGEIFNYIELRADLLKRGHAFSTESDVEVLVHLYEEKGMELLNDLNGQFAFALYDRRQKRLFCARDHLGILPFFYTKVGDDFVFASEIKAILEYPGVTKEVDRVGLDQVLTFPGLISPRTMFKDICSLENGHYLCVSADGGVTDRQYWDLIYPEGEVAMNGKPEEAYVDQLEELFESSIKLRMRTDVPLGFYLSGGLDSSMILMKAHQLYQSMSKHAFCIDFADAQLSESVYQRQIAAESNAVLNRKVFHQADIGKRLALSVYHSECPIKETYNTASLSLSESVRAKQIKVIQSGEGADEFFAGYVGYRFDKMRKAQRVGGYTDPEELLLRDRLWGDEHFIYERNFLEWDKVKQQLYAGDVMDIYDDINCINHPIVDRQRLVGRSALSRRGYLDYKLRLVDHLVSDHGDRMALANSVEVRYPFMDRRIAEFSASLPADLKLNGLTEKYILRRMAKRFVPREVTEREKFHFVAPGSPSLLRENFSFIEDVLSYDRIKRQGFFNPDEIQRLKKEYIEDGFMINEPYESDLLIVVMTFGLLLEQFFN